MYGINLKIVGSFLGVCFVTGDLELNREREIKWH
jgi:hypothetical protein